MSMSLLLILYFLIFSNLTTGQKYYELPRFWTNTGFCPLGEITNSGISRSLLSSDVQTNLELIGALPNQGVKTVRVHWLLELIKLVQFDKNGFAGYDFRQLDEFVDIIDNASLALQFEFMGCPDRVDFKNVSKDVFWEDLSFQIVERYLERYGADKIRTWKFESWNEPDLKSYNKLNFTVPEYLNYLDSLRRGLNAAARQVRGLKLQLRGPAGLFKNPRDHPLCWSVLEKCADDLSKCPLDIFTFHRKGQGKASELVDASRRLMAAIIEIYPEFGNMKISNDEADPVAGWSTPRPFQSDVHYAVILVQIVMKYWTAMLNTRELSKLESISHDNAFLSYHPHEFDQRTLFARFQMNLTSPPHSQFVQKPVYAALGMLSNLGKFATDIEHLPEYNVTRWTTFGPMHKHFPLYAAHIFMPLSETGSRTNFKIEIDLPKRSSATSTRLAYFVEGMETGTTDPVKVWNFYGRPPYPNATVREHMRRSQGPVVYYHAIDNYTETIVIGPLSFRVPWIALLRICDSDVAPPFQPQNFRAKQITKGEVLLLWKDIETPEKCVKTYEIFFSKHSKEEWRLISKEYHVPFLFFHFQPTDEIISGSYKARAVDIFNRTGEFSDIFVVDDD